MSALARRQISAIATDLAARDGGPAARRGAALLRRLDGTDEAAVAISDLALAPAWLRLPRAAQRRIGRLAALVSIAPHLAKSIDGAWLGGIATVAGEAAVDWAIGEIVDPTMVLPIVDADHLAARGASLLRASLPVALRGLVVPSGDRLDDVAPAIALACVARALSAPETV
ncbi:hypothetical protein U1872_03635 [Sphingomonas sp. RB3P16]|uniref:hypothetical protein n=1 Tax=Parasphingomonas frigoris TaxID=3096163 RepID=UPI002FC6FF07